jgi:general stress protein 26
MKTPIYPLPSYRAEDSSSFSLDDCDDVLGLLKALIDGSHPGLLTTVDEANHPHARWMATLAFDNFPFVYSLTARKSRKLAHIAKNPYVDWTFSNENLSLVLNLSGIAKALSEPAQIKKVWRLVKDKSHAYFLDNFSENPEFVALETTVTGIECCIPQSGLRWSVEADSLKPYGTN